MVVLIRNDSFSDVRVLAIVGEGNRVRLGMVGALSRRALILPFTVPASAGLQLIAEPLAAGDVHSTEPIRTSQGDTIEWVLANHVEISRWFIR